MHFFGCEQKYLDGDNFFVQMCDTSIALFLVLFFSMGKSPLHKISWALVIIGAINWGLLGVSKFNLVMSLFGQWPTLERVIYILIGVAGVAAIFQSMKDK